MNKRKWFYVFTLIYVIVIGIVGTWALFSKDIENAIFYEALLISWFIGDIWLQQSRENEEIMSKLDELEKKLDEDILLKNKIKVSTYLDVEKLKDMLDNKKPNDFTWTKISFDKDKVEDTESDESKKKTEKSESDEDNLNKTDKSDK